MDFDLSIICSTLSSQGSAIACIVWEDLLKMRPYYQHFTDKQATNVIKFLSAITGVAAIALGMIVGHLGTIFMVAYSIMSALKGPLGGLFLAGICTPWVNRKGAAVGFVASFMINVWLIIGKFVRGGGNPTTLPLSDSGCDGNVASLKNATSVVMNHFSSSSRIAFPPEGNYNTLYDISYCYSGFIGIILTLVISSFVSLCTGNHYYFLYCLHSIFLWGTLVL
ncbi:sodium-coupled monocarboxylate transporter 1-like [Palaemon carinicauda]|uniref:sodium-coupled monocarboxylate transporter 1-like n=1 Tax=Palaemon carinicauda TaxID=392227 RepID=UPI0035B66211